MVTNKQLQQIEKEKKQLFSLTYGKDDVEIIRLGCQILSELAKMVETHKPSSAIKQEFFQIYCHILKAPFIRESDFFEEQCSTKLFHPFIHDLTALHYQLAIETLKHKQPILYEFHLRKAVQYSPTPELCQKLSQAYLSEKNLTAAFAALRHYQGPFHPLIFFQTLYCLNKRGDFAAVEKAIPQIKTLIAKGDATASPLFLKWIGIDQPTILKLAHNFQKHLENKQDFRYHGKRVKSKKLRIGYIGTNFFKHAQAHQFGETFFKNHGPHFEVFVYLCHSSGDTHEIGRLKQAVHTFVDLTEVSNEEAVKRMRADELDIVVNCNGFADDRRPYEILCHRVAPIQIDYLGYPGSSGASYIDYFIGDPISTPIKEAEPSFTEKLILMPHTYQLTEHQEAFADFPTEKLTPEISKGALFALIKKNEPLVGNSILSYISKEAIEEIQNLFNAIYTGSHPITTFAHQLKWLEEWSKEHQMPEEHTTSLNHGLQQAFIAQKAILGDPVSTAAVQSLYIDRMVPPKEFVQGRFIFCSLNHHVKITAEDISRWNQILYSVKESILVIPLMFSRLPEQHLRTAFDPDVRNRIYFVGNAPKWVHMHRLRSMGCMLDSFHYGAHTSTGDALWAQVPVVTQIGESMESRVCASMLTAAGLNDLIATDRQGYIERAVRCATDPQYYQSLLDTLKQARSSHLFNRKEYLTNLCLAYHLAWERFCDHAPPDHIRV